MNFLKVEGPVEIEESNDKTPETRPRRKRSYKPASKEMNDIIFQIGSMPFKVNTEGIKNAEDKKVD